MRERSPVGSHFTIIPNEVLRDTSISIKARGLLALLMTYADNWEFRADHLQQVSGMGRDQFEAAMRELRQAGYVETVTRRNEKGQLEGKTWIIRDKARRNPENPSIGDNTEALKNRLLEKPSAGKPADIRRSTDQEDQSSKEDQHAFSAESNRATKANVTLEEQFAEFWRAYPRQEGRRAALSAFKRAVRDGAAPLRIISAARTYGAQRNGVEERFIQLPKNWLNDGGWEEVGNVSADDQEAERRRKRLSGPAWGEIVR